MEELQSTFMVRRPMMSVAIAAIRSIGPMQTAFEYGRKPDKEADPLGHEFFSVMLSYGYRAEVVADGVVGIVPCSKMSRWAELDKALLSAIAPFVSTNSRLVWSTDSGTILSVEFLQGEAHLKERALVDLSDIVKSDSAVGMLRDVRRFVNMSGIKMYLPDSSSEILHGVDDIVGTSS